MSEERQEEDVSTLNFGPEFSSKVECLSDAEVTMLLEKRKNQGADDELRPLTLKTWEYTKRSLGERTVQEAMHETISLRQALSNPNLVSDDHGLYPFEIAALCNLMSKDSEPEEAKALIPSLKRYDDDILDNVLAEMNKVRSN